MKNYAEEITNRIREQYVKCVKNVEETSREYGEIYDKLRLSGNELLQSEYAYLNDRLTILDVQMKHLSITRNVWNKAREICLDVLDKIEIEGNMDTWMEIVQRIGKERDDCFDGHRLINREYCRIHSKIKSKEEEAKITHKEWYDLMQKYKKLDRMIDRMFYEFDTWDKALVICIDVVETALADGECDA